MSGARHRRKGARIERDIVEHHRALGVHAERYPLGGASRFRGSGHDIDVYALGRDKAPLIAEVKARANGAGFSTLEKWLGDFDALFLRRNGAQPLFIVSWRTWVGILSEVPR
jgi:Holliday junction resolvase